MIRVCGSRITIDYSIGAISNLNTIQVFKCKRFLPIRVVVGRRSGWYSDYSWNLMSAAAVIQRVISNTTQPASSVGIAVQRGECRSIHLRRPLAGDNIITHHMHVRILIVVSVVGPVWKPGNGIRFKPGKKKFGAVPGTGNLG